MIEQQIRPWDVLDPAVLALLAAVKREDFVPAGATARWPSSTPRCRCRARRRAAVHAGAQGRGPPAAGARVQRHEQVLEIGAGSGYMAALLAHRAQHVITLEIDPELARLAARQPAPRRRRQRRRCARPTAPAACRPKAPFDVIVLSGSVAEVPRALLRAAQGRRPAGRHRRRAADDARARSSRAPATQGFATRRAVRHRRAAPARLRRADALPLLMPPMSQRPRPSRAAVPRR